MRRLVWAFAGRTYHIVGNLMSRLILWKQTQIDESICAKSILDFGGIKCDKILMTKNNKQDNGE